ncbi:MAG: DUF5916 domain-containing protein [Lutibacter sp.]
MKRNHLNMHFRLLFFTLILIPYFSIGQQKPKVVSALKIKISPKIDGELNEPFWQHAQEAKNFVMFNPGDGDAEHPTKNTSVKVAYNNKAIFIGAVLNDDEIQKIPRQFGVRDQIGNVDFFLVSINPYNDGQNDFEFVVMSTGAQADAKVIDGNEDFSWNAVWKSAVKMNNDNWTIEIRIPYSELRFSNQKEQTWGINFHRRIHYLNEQFVWNYIDKKKGQFTQYAGLLKNINNINPPIRLSFFPYASSTYASSKDDINGWKSNMGMDLKYGLSEGFTLDATLIPDFGQTAFDNRVLNLGPFEQRYREQRAFFTEGTELFSKGGLFYSRRIGNSPVGATSVEENLNSDEEIVKNPSKVKLLNALKVSGRTKKGLGIGFFNAITEKTKASIKNINTNEIKSIVTEPFTNYNVLVLDQQFNKNSSVSFVNTSVLRNGTFRDANVSALIFDLANKKNKYALSGSYKQSIINENKTQKKGYASFLKFEKIAGNVQYKVVHWQSNDKYDINDLGFQRNNNYANYYGEISYQIFKPTKHFNQYRIELGSKIEYQNNPHNYVGNEYRIESFFVTRNRFAFGSQIETNIGPQYDFYEPRVDGRYFKQNGILFSTAWISTDYRKKFAVDIHIGYGIRYHNNNIFRTINISPRYRFTDKFQVIYSLELSKMAEEKGWVNELNDGSIIFGNRTVKTITNNITGTYNFDTKKALNLAFRYYWSPVQYSKQFYSLTSSGDLTPNNYEGNHDINYNIWNLDLSFNWEFAPGSQLIALYRNSIFKEDDLSSISFSKNISNLFKEPITNILSIKFIYFLDYNQLKKRT